MGAVLIIVGLPGSGKTTLAEMLLANRLNYVIAKNGDGVTSLVQAPFQAKFFDDAAATQEGLDALCHHLLEGGNAVVTDVYALDETYRISIDEKLRGWGASHINWLFFEKDADACLANIEGRKNGKKVLRQAVYAAEVRYDIPKHALRVPVYKPKGLDDLEALMREIIPHRDDFEVDNAPPKVIQSVQKIFDEKGYHWSVSMEDPWDE